MPTAKGRAETSDAPAITKVLGKFVEEIEGKVGPKLKQADGRSIRSVIVELAMDQTLWGLFQRMSNSVPASLIERIVQAREPIQFEHLSRKQQQDLQHGFSIYREALSGYIVLATALPRPPSSDADANSVPSCEVHPQLKRIAMLQRMSDVALVGLGSARSYSYSEGVLNALGPIWVEGKQAFLSYVVGMAKMLEIPLPYTASFLPNEPLDVKRLIAEMAKASAGRKKMLTEAKKSKLPVYPLPVDGDLA